MKHAIAVQQQQPLLVDTRFLAAETVIGLLKPGGRIVGSNLGQFSMIDLILATLAVVGPADVQLTTWRIAQSEVETLRQLVLDERIRKFSIHLDRSFSDHHAEMAVAIQGMFGADSVVMSRMHAKIALISAGDWRVVIRGSMNLNINKRVENFDIDDSPPIYNFLAGVLTDVGQAMPAKIAASWREISAAIERLRRGVSLLSLTTREQVRAAAPLEDADEWHRWCLTMFARQKKKRRRAAAAIGVTLEELADIIETAEPQERAEDLAAWLLDATTIPVQGRTT